MQGATFNWWPKMCQHPVLGNKEAQSSSNNLWSCAVTHIDTLTEVNDPCLQVLHLPRHGWLRKCSRTRKPTGATNSYASIYPFTFTHNKMNVEQGEAIKSIAMHVLKCWYDKNFVGSCYWYFPRVRDSARMGEQTLSWHKEDQRSIRNAWLIITSSLPCFQWTCADAFVCPSEHEVQVATESFGQNLSLH